MPVLCNRNKRGVNYAEVGVYNCLFCLSFAGNGQMFFVKILRIFFEKNTKKLLPNQEKSCILVCVVT